MLIHWNLSAVSSATADLGQDDLDATFVTAQTESQDLKRLCMPPFALDVFCIAILVRGYDLLDAMF